MKINFKNLFKPSIIISSAITVLGVLMLIIFGGKTSAEFTTQNLRFSLFARAFVASALTVLLTLIYFAIRFKKKGVFLSLFSALSALISGVVGFALCVICRAPLGGITFAVMLLGVFLSYITSVIFANNYTFGKASRKKKGSVATDNYTFAAEKTWISLVGVLALICIVLVVAFVLSLIFAVKAVPMYALPAIITSVFSVLQTIAVCGKLYTDKV